MTGIIKGYEVKKNRDGLNNVLMLNVEISGSDDVQSVEYMSYAGDNHIPPIGSIVKILTAGKAWKIAIASNDNQDFDSSLSEGDRTLYSKSKNSILKILDNGNIIMEFGTTNITFSASGMIVDIAGVTYNFITHLHPTGVGPSGPPTPGT